MDGIEKHCIIIIGPIYGLLKKKKKKRDDYYNRRREHALLVNSKTYKKKKYNMCVCVYNIRRLNRRRDTYNKTEENAQVRSTRARERTRRNRNGASGINRKPNDITTIPRYA